MFDFASSSDCLLSVTFSCVPSVVSNTFSLLNSIIFGTDEPLLLATRDFVSSLVSVFAVLFEVLFEFCTIIERILRSCDHIRTDYGRLMLNLSKDLTAK